MAENAALLCELANLFNGIDNTVRIAGRRTDEHDGIVINRPLHRAHVDSLILRARDERVVEIEVVERLHKGGVSTLR